MSSRRVSWTDSQLHGQWHGPRICCADVVKWLLGQGMQAAPADEGAVVTGAAPDLGIDEPIFMKESMKLGPFQTQIECKTKPLLWESTHAMVMPLKSWRGSAR